jgi:hypothetical protein
LIGVPAALASHNNRVVLVEFPDCVAVAVTICDDRSGLESERVLRIISKNGCRVIKRLTIFVAIVVVVGGRVAFFTTSEFSLSSLSYSSDEVSCC